MKDLFAGTRAILWCLGVALPYTLSTPNKQGTAGGTKLVWQADCPDANYVPDATLETICGGSVLMNLTNVGPMGLAEPIQAGSFWGRRCHDRITPEDLARGDIVQTDAVMAINSLNPGDVVPLTDLHTAVADLPPTFTCLPGCMMGGVKNSSSDTWQILIGGQFRWDDSICGVNADYQIEVFGAQQRANVHLHREEAGDGTLLYHYFNLWDYIGRIEVTADMDQPQRPKELAHAITLYFRDTHEWRHQIVAYDEPSCNDGSFIPEISLNDELAVDLFFTDAMTQNVPKTFDSTSHPDLRVVYDNKTCSACGNLSLVIQFDTVHSTEDPQRCNNFYTLNLTISCPEEIRWRDVVQVFPDHLSQGVTTHFRRCYGLDHDAQLVTRKNGGWQGRHTGSLDDLESQGLMRARTFALRLVNMAREDGTLDDTCADVIRRESRDEYWEDGTQPKDFSPDCHEAIHDMILDQPMIDGPYSHSLQNILDRCPADSHLVRIIHAYRVRDPNMNGQPGGNPVDFYDIGDPELEECPQSPELWTIFYGGGDSPSVMSAIHRDMMVTGSEIERRHQQYVNPAAGRACSDNITDTLICGYRLLNEFMRSPAKLMVADDIRRKLRDMEHSQPQESLRNIVSYLYQSMNYTAPNDLHYLERCERPDPLEPRPNIPVYYTVKDNRVYMTSDGSYLGEQRFCWHPVGVLSCPNCQPGYDQYPPASSYYGSGAVPEYGPGSGFGSGFGSGGGPT